VLPFKTKAEYERPLPPETLTTEDAYRKLEEETLARLRDLLQYYERTGRWTAAADQPFIDAVHQLKMVCRVLAENTHGTTDARGNSREATEAHQDSRQDSEPQGE
jgi:hypothetical protein